MLAEILADSLSYLNGAELIATVYFVNRLFHRVASEHPAGVRSVLRLDRIVTRSLVSRVDEERLLDSIQQ